MFGRSIKIFSLFGFDIKIDLSWLIIVVLITWSLATGLFPSYYQNLSQLSLWLMGFIGAIGLFASIILHEVSHSLVARKYGVPIRSITLFLFGGVASIAEEPKSAKVEFLMAIAGPLASIVIGLFCFGMMHMGKWIKWPVPVYGVFGYLAFINWILAGFNLIPAFPLDGGRILRAALWKWKNNMKKATRIASLIGSGFGFMLIALGIIQFITGYIVNGVWWFIIGFFLDNSARSSYKKLLMDEVIAGVSAAKVMNENPVNVPPFITIEELVEDYIYKYHYKIFPVVDNGKLTGCISTEQIKEIPRDDWKNKKVGDVSKDCSVQNTITPDMEVQKAWSMMNRTGSGMLMVASGDQLVGILTSKDIMDLLSVKMELNKVSSKKSNL